ncbi:MAG: FG-GAP repeat protein, partial [Thermoleophilia bacterium]|nr:FG-GAP repeat protein [Thermoleophilia bacterium]
MRTFASVSRSTGPPSARDAADAAAGAARSASAPASSRRRCRRRVRARESGVRRVTPEMSAGSHGSLTPRRGQRRGGTARDRHLRADAIPAWRSARPQTAPAPAGERPSHTCPGLIRPRAVEAMAAGPQTRAPSGCWGARRRARTAAPQAPGGPGRSWCESTRAVDVPMITEFPLRIPLRVLTILLAAIAAAAVPAVAVLPQQSGSVDLLSQANIHVSGAEAGARAGYSVAAAGDVNGDGRDDLILGAPLADSNGRTDSGSAYVLFGSASPVDVDLAYVGAAGFRIDGAVAGDKAGWSVAGAGDVNGDGR